MTTFAEEFKRQRMLSSNSQSRVAERAELNHSYVSRMEAGTRIPSREVIDKLAVVMNSKPEDHDRLLSLAGYRPNSPFAIFADHPEIRELWEYLNNENVPLDKRKATRAIVRNLLKAVGD